MVPTDIRVGVVGLGPHFMETLLPALIGQPGIILAAFCDRSSEKLEWARARFSYAVITEDISSPEFWAAVDCVVCCSWPHVHERVLTLAIEHGKHCLCEKPVASSALTLGQILEKKPSPGLVMRVGHTFRYMGGARRFIELVNQDDLMCLEITYLGSGPNGSRWGMTSRTSFSLTHLTHAIDFATAAAGNVTQVLNVAWVSAGDTNTVAIVLATTRCPLVNLFVTNAAPAFTCKASGVLRIGGLVHLDSLRNVTLTGKAPAGKRDGAIWKERDLGTIPQNDGYMGEFADFFAEVRGTGQCHLPDLTHAKHVLEIIEAL